MEESTSLKNYFFYDFLKKIFRGNLKVNDKICSMRDLSLDYSISKSVVHVGLVELTEKGFLYKRKHHYFVSNDYKYDKLEALIYLINNNGETPTKEEIISLIQLKGEMDILAIKLIKDKDPSDIINEMRTNIKIINSKSKDADKNYDKDEINREYAEVFSNFYCKFYMLSGNVVLSVFINALRECITHLWMIFISKNGHEVLCENIETTFRLLSEGKYLEIYELISDLVSSACSGDLLFF